MDCAYRVDGFLRGHDEFAPSAVGAASGAWLVGATVVFGAAAGAAMGSYACAGAGRWAQPLFSALKVPLLLFGTYALSVPTFFVANSLFGLRADFRTSLYAMTAMQACLAIVLASLAPLTLLAYASGISYAGAVFFNGILFFVSSLASQRVVFRYYLPLILQDPRHVRMLGVWLSLYIFVGIQGAWVMRPYIGNPDVPVQFLRPGAWGNAYVAVIKLTRQVLAP